MFINEDYGCCGVAEIASLYDLSEAEIKRILVEENAMVGAAYYFFTRSNKENKKSEGKGITSLLKLIRKNNWGNVRKFGPRVNPNTLHRITFYVWAPNKKYKTWLKREYEKAEAAYDF